MEFKLVFYDKQTNNEKWWNRLFDRLSTIKHRKWEIEVMGKYGDQSLTFKCTIPDGSKPTQEEVNQIVWCLLIDQINIDRFYACGKDVTRSLVHR